METGAIHGSDSKGTHGGKSDGGIRISKIAGRTRFLALALMVIFSFLYHGFGGEMARAGERVTCSVEHIAQEDTDDAILSLRRALSLDSNHHECALRLAQHAAAVGDSDEAVRLLTDIPEAAGLGPLPLDLRGRLAEEGGNSAAAHAIYRELTAQTPDSLAGPLGSARLGDPESLRVRTNEWESLEVSSTESWRGIALLHLTDDFGARGYGTPAAADSLGRARRLGVNSVSLRVPGRQASIADPAITFGRESLGGETDLAVRRTIRDAHLLGLDVLLKPHVMLGRITDEEWRGTIAYDSYEDLDRWWHSYSDFILHYARFAEEEKVATFSIGVELRAMVAAAPERWSHLIAEVREVYSGKLTYAANWYYEYDEVPFWGELDFIGVQFFFPLSESENPTLDELRDGIAPIVTELQDLAMTHQRPVLLTEVGYKSVQGTTQEPWQWPDFDATPDPAMQAKAYRAILESFSEQSGFSGLFWWNWLTEPEPGEKFRNGFTPQGKEAEKVLGEYWRE